jgi:pseudouridine-5'-monophosphatase
VACYPYHNLLKMRNLTLLGLFTLNAIAIGVVLRLRRSKTVAKRKTNAGPDAQLGFLFDLDGTLLDFEGASHLALNSPLEKLGKHVDWALHASICGKPAHYWSKEVLNRLEVTEMSPDEFSREFHEHIKLAFPTMTLMPGALAIVKRLRALFPEAGFAIATSSERHSFDVKMSFHPELLSYFDVIVTGNEIPRGKPNPDIFLEAARRLGVEPHRCAVFEDAPSGAQAGRRAGATVIAIPDDRMVGNETAFSFVDFKLRSLLDLDEDLVDSIIHRMRTKPPPNFAITEAGI